MEIDKIDIPPHRADAAGKWELKIRMERAGRAT